MRHLVVALVTVLALGLAGSVLIHSGDSETDASSSPSPQKIHPVNAILGNESFRMVFGRTPTTETPERLRLQTHLAVVETLLRRRSTPTLSGQQRERRKRLLDALHKYWVEGQFPRNTEVPGRSPVFIDAVGRLCAVGHLIAVSAGRDVAESIDEEYHLAKVPNIDAPILSRWAERNGFTQRELAMIQPAYDGDPCCVIGPGQNDADHQASTLETAALSASVGVSVLNGALLVRGSPNVIGGAVGVGSGATSLAIGLTDDSGYPTVSALAGATSVALGAWTLVAALRDDSSPDSEPPPPVARRSLSTWQVYPMTVTTVRGESLPGVQATIRF